MISDQTRRKKSQQVSSRYLSPIEPPPSPPSSTNQKHKNKHKHTGFIRGLWPSSTTNNSSKSHNENSPSTGADHLGNERRKDGVIKRFGNLSFLSKEKSFNEHNLNSKTLAGKLMLTGRSSISSSTKSSEFFDSNQVILPGRLSVDENALRRRALYDNNSDQANDLGNGSPFTNYIRNSPASYMASTMSSRKSGLIEVPSKYYNMTSNSSTPIHNSPNNKSTFKPAMKRTNSVSSKSSEWEPSPSRFGSPSSSFSSSKPPRSSSSRGGTKKNLLHMGLDLIKGKKGGSKMGSDNGKYSIESVHQLRLLQNSWMQ